MKSLKLKIILPIFLGLFLSIPYFSHATLTNSALIPTIGSTVIVNPSGLQPDFSVYAEWNDADLEYADIRLYAETDCTNEFSPTGNQFVGYGYDPFPYNNALKLWTSPNPTATTIRCITLVLFDEFFDTTEYVIATSSTNIWTFQNGSILSAPVIASTTPQAYGQNEFFGLLLFVLGAIGGVYTFRQFLS